MSLINQMLQDLDQRKADGGATAAQVRAVRKPARSPLQGWGGALLLVLAVGAAGSYWMFGVSADKARQALAHEQPPGTSQTSAPADNTPSVLQLASELSFQPATSIHKAKKERDAAPVDNTPRPEIQPPAPDIVETVQPQPQPLSAEVKKSAVALDLPQAAGVNKEVRQPTSQQRAENAYRQAYAGLQQGRLGEAEENLRLALQYEPRHAAARQALAALLVESRHLDKAEQLLQQGLELQPGNSGHAMTLARIQVERGDVAAALATLQRNPPASENAEYHGFLAALLQRSERHKDAIEHYLAALRSNPGAGPWLLGLGISMQADGQAAKALEIFRRARQSTSLSPELQAFAEQRINALQ